MRIVLVLFSSLWIVLSSTAGVSSRGPTGANTKDLMVIPVRFSDVTNATTLEFLENRVFEEMDAYYWEVSFDRVGITGGILDQWVDIPRNMSYYGNYSDNNHSLGAKQLIKDAIDMVDDAIDFSVYRFVMVVHAGRNEARSRNITDIWSWGWWSELGLATKDGVIFQQGAVVSERDSLGTFCHEFGHTLGLPDLYDYNQSAVVDFAGPWGVMGQGELNDNGTHPSHPLAWSKMKLGWVDASQIAIVNDRDKTVRVEPLERSTTGITIVKIPITSPSHYYLVEVRRRILYDSYLPSEGVIVTLIDETRASGQGIVKVVDAIESTTTLDDAAFTVDFGGSAIFLDASNDLGVVLLREVDLSFDIHMTSYLNGRIAKEARVALAAAEQKIRMLMKRESESVFILLSTIDLSLASAALEEAKEEYESQQYLEALVDAHGATIAAWASELRLANEEMNLRCWFATSIAIVLGALAILYLRCRSRARSAKTTFNVGSIVSESG